MDFFVTFSSNHKDRNGNSLSKAYLPFFAADYDDACNFLFSKIGSKWAFVYPIDRLDEFKENGFVAHSVSITELPKA